jgi:Zn-dependent protease/predicted transcriptional regulator
MPGRSIRIARIAGIPVGVSPLWLVIVALITWSLGASYFPEEIHGIEPVAAYALGLASAMLLFASILAHEFGHALVARRHGIEVEEIDLWLLGGVSRMRNEAHDPADELRYALAGPAVTAVVAGAFAVLALVLPAGTPAAIRVLVEYQLLINCLLFAFNLMPAFPLDGGRVLRSLLWRRSHDMASATERAARIGRGFGYALIAFGGLEFFSGYPEGLWLAVIGFFIVAAAGAQAMGAQINAVFSGVRAAELMSTPAVSVPARATVAQAVSEFFIARRYTSFPVVDDAGRAVGLISIGQAQSLTAEQREHERVFELAERDPELIVGEDEDVAHLLEQPAFARAGRAVVVDGTGRPAGLLSITDVQRVLRVSALDDHPSDGGARSGGARRRTAIG